jgi:hypothetical protein
MLKWMLALAFCGCSAVAEDTDLQRPDAGDMGSDAGDLSQGIQHQNGGSLPFGFYQKQCQWDACNPAPSQLIKSPSTDPTP